MTTKKRATPVKPPAPTVMDEKFTIRDYRLKAKSGHYVSDSAPAEDAAVIIADLQARVETAERCGIAPRLTVNSDYSILTLYGWRKVTR